MKHIVIAGENANWSIKTTEKLQKVIFFKFKNSARQVLSWEIRQGIMTSKIYRWLQKILCPAPTHPVGQKMLFSIRLK